MPAYESSLHGILFPFRRLIVSKQAVQTTASPWGRVALVNTEGSSIAVVRPIVGARHSDKYRIAAKRSCVVANRSK